MLKLLNELKNLYADHKFKEDFKVALYLFIEIGQALAEQNYVCMTEIEDREERDEPKGVTRYVWIVTRADAIHCNRRLWLRIVKSATEYVVSGDEEKLKQALAESDKARASEEPQYIENNTFKNAALSVVWAAVNYYRDERDESQSVKQFPKAEDFKQC